MDKTPISQYAIYKIRFFVDKEKSIQNHDKDAESYLKKAEECMLSLFDMKQIKGLYKLRKDKDPIIYPNDVMCEIRYNVIWWRVNNVLFKSFVTKTGNDQNGRAIYETDKQESNPFANVIFDLRPEVLQIAIEQTAAWPNTDKLCELLKESFHRLLSDNFGLDLDIEPKMEPTMFWDYIHKQIYEYNDQIKKVTFSFGNTLRVKGISHDQMHNSRLKAMAMVAEASDALKSQFIMEFDKNSDKRKFTEKNRDIAEMVNLCCDNAYDIKISFKNAKVYRIGDYVKACFPMPIKYLHDFSNNSLNIYHRLDLIDWLDDIRNKILNYDYEQQIPTRRNK